MANVTANATSKRTSGASAGQYDRRERPPGRMTDMKLINLTPHEISIIETGPKPEYKKRMRVIPPSGEICRVREEVLSFPKTSHPFFKTGGEVPTENGYRIVTRAKRIFSQLEGLPDARTDTIFMVSMIAAMEAWASGRFDVVATGEPIRGDDGRITGCYNIMMPPEFFYTAAERSAAGCDSNHGFDK